MITWAATRAIRCACPGRETAACARGAVSGQFGRRLGEQESSAVIDAVIESQSRRGLDYVRVIVALTVAALDVAGALDQPWRAFRKAADDDAAGWDMASVTAEVRPGELNQ